MAIEASQSGTHEELKVKDQLLDSLSLSPRPNWS